MRSRRPGARRHPAKMTTASWLALRAKRDVPVFTGASAHGARIVTVGVVARPRVRVVARFEVEGDAALAVVARGAHAGHEVAGQVFIAPDLGTILQKILGAGQRLAVR